MPLGASCENTTHRLCVRCELVCVYALFASTGACAMWARGMLLVRHVCSVMRHIGLVPVPPVNAPMGQRVYKVRACVVLTNLDNQVVPCGDPVSGCPACVAVVSPQVCRPVDVCGTDNDQASTSARLRDRDGSARRDGHRRHAMRRPSDGLRARGGRRRPSAASPRSPCRARGGRARRGLAAARRRDAARRGATRTAAVSK